MSAFFSRRVLPSIEARREKVEKEKESLETFFDEYKAFLEGRERHPPNSKYHNSICFHYNTLAEV